MSWYICEHCCGCYSADQIAACLGFCPDCGRHQFRDG